MTNLLRYMKEKSNYNTKEEAVEFLMNETNLTYEECSKANDFHIRLNKKNLINIRCHTFSGVFTKRISL